MDGLLKFAEEIKWPYLSEIQETTRELLLTPAADVNTTVRALDWSGGLVIPAPYSSWRRS